MTFGRIENIDVKGKTVLVRVDYNVPLKDGVVLDDTRLQTSVPTLKYLLEQGAKVIILTHLGRPKGVTPALSLHPLTSPLKKLLNEDIVFCPTLTKEAIQHMWQTSPNARVMLLENIRFYEGEETNDVEFSKTLGGFGDIYVNDAFSVSHRAHASVEGITHHIPSYAGFYLNQEVDAINSFFTTPHPPVAAIVGGSKVSSKFNVLQYLLKRVDHLIIGGGMANTFLKAKGFDIGDSLYEPDLIDAAQKLMGEASTLGCTLHLPLDVTVAQSLESTWCTVDSHAIPATFKAFDIGPKTIDHIKGVIETCHTVLWNGPVGVFEKPPFDTGSMKIAAFIAEKTSKNTNVNREDTEKQSKDEIKSADTEKQPKNGEKTPKNTLKKPFFSLAGGGETVAVLQKTGVFNHFSYVSTAGGAFLEYMEGKELPGLCVLRI